MNQGVHCAGDARCSVGSRREQRLPRSWVLSRVLMFGDLRQVRAARSFFGDEAIREALRRREVDRRTHSFWSVVLDEEDASEGT
jgi:hypothetical protein